MDSIVLHIDPKNIVISQSMYFPWVGILEQIRLSDCFVHYDDVQYARGFYNRVQVKTPAGLRWMTVPLKASRRDCSIDNKILDDSLNWKSKHREILRHSYSRSPYCKDVLNLVDHVFSLKCNTLAQLSRASMIALADYFDLLDGKKFIDSRDLRIGGSSSKRLLNIVLHLKGNTYITGHGARNYLDHELFERSNVNVRYMEYKRIPYPQLYGDFTPYVTALDLIANCGKDGRKFVISNTINWRGFINASS